MNKNVTLATFLLLAGSLITTVVATAPAAYASEQQNNEDNDAKVKIYNEADDHSNAFATSCNNVNVMKAGFDCLDDPYIGKKYRGPE